MSLLLMRGSKSLMKKCSKAIRIEIYMDKNDRFLSFQ